MKEQVSQVAQHTHRGEGQRWTGRTGFEAGVTAKSGGTLALAIELIALSVLATSVCGKQAVEAGRAVVGGAHIEKGHVGFEHVVLGVIFCHDGRGREGDEGEAGDEVAGCSPQRHAGEHDARCSAGAVARA